MTQRQIEISAVLPVYRNAPILPELHRRLRVVLEATHRPFEIVFVSDACPAGSLSVLESIAGTDSNVRVLALARNVGQHAAVLEGLASARGAIAVVMDADLQDPPEAIPLLLEKLNEGYDVVFAGRRGRYESRARLFTSRIFKSLLGSVSGLPVDAGMYFVATRTLIDRLLAMRTERPFVVAMVGRTRLSSASVPVARARRSIGRSAYAPRDRLRAAFHAFLCAFGWGVRSEPREEVSERAEVWEPK